MMVQVEFVTFVSSSNRVIPGERYSTGDCRAYCRRRHYRTVGMSVQPEPQFPELAVEVLLDWYRQYHRQLPWRETRNPYRIMVSEIMLQQTQADRVVPKYHEFLS